MNPNPQSKLILKYTQVKEKIPSLEELGGNQLYPADPTIGLSPISPRTHWQLIHM